MWTVVKSEFLPPYRAGRDLLIHILLWAVVWIPAIMNLLRVVSK